MPLAFTHEDFLVCDEFTVDVNDPTEIRVETTVAVALCEKSMFPDGRAFSTVNHARLHELLINDEHWSSLFTYGFVMELRL